MMAVSTMRISRSAMVRIQASRCAFIAVVSDMRLTNLPSEASVCSTQARRKKPSAARSAVDR